MPDTTRPEDFRDIFQRPGVLIVGGHAVNLWASYYAPRGDTELASFAPFLSKDGDIFLRDKEIAKAVASAAGWKFRNNPEPRSPVLGHIYLVKDRHELTIDVLRSVRGLTTADLAATEKIQLMNGRTYSVPAPEVMLKAKLANLASISQENRSDHRHVRIMVVCCRHYLCDVYRAALSQDLSERDAVNRFMATMRVIRDPNSVEMDAKHGLGLSAAIPARSELKEISSLPRLVSFYEHQMSLKQTRGPRFSV